MHKCPLHYSSIREDDQPVFSTFTQAYSGGHGPDVIGDNDDDNDRKNEAFPMQNGLAVDDDVISPAVPSVQIYGAARSTEPPARLE